MTEELTQAIEGLYSAFSVYPFRSTMEGCPCCVSDEDKATLCAQPLRQLEGEQIAHYAFKAMTTWGGVDDFKHYLPRIFELLATQGFIVDTFVVLGKLGYANWADWEIAEKEAINTFLLAWWTDVIKNKHYFDKEAFIEIYQLVADIRLLLDRWIICFEDNSFSNYIDFMYDYYSDLAGKNTSFKELDKSAADTLLRWVNDQKQWMESGFFYFEKTDPAFAEKISNTLYIVERT